MIAFVLASRTKPDFLRGGMPSTFLQAPLRFFFTEYYLGSDDTANGDADHRAETNLHAGFYNELAIPLDEQILSQQVRALRSREQSLTSDNAAAVQLVKTAVVPIVVRPAGVH